MDTTDWGFIEFALLITVGSGVGFFCLCVAIYFFVVLLIIWSQMLFLPFTVGNEWSSSDASVPQKTLGCIVGAALWGSCVFLPPYLLYLLFTSW